MITQLKNLKMTRKQRIKVYKQMREHYRSLNDDYFMLGMCTCLCRIYENLPSNASINLFNYKELVELRTTYPSHNYWWPMDHTWRTKRIQILTIAITIAESCTFWTRVKTFLKTKIFSHDKTRKVVGVSRDARLL